MEEEKNSGYLVMPDKIEWEKLTLFYGKVVIQPLERGFSTTLGNSLRRVLLSSISGAAITSVKIDGVQHEFSTIPGVVEDVPQVISNLKQIIIKLYDGSEGKKFLLDVKEPGEVRAGDIQADKDAEILNPRLHIATLNEGAHLRIEMEVGKGKGYLPASRDAIANAPVGTIPVDALFSPIKKVNFKVEDTRVGERTDYEKLTLEIWTDGSITPDESLECANRILIQHFEFILESLKKQAKERITEALGKGKLEDREKLLSKNIADFDLSVRSINCLKRTNVNTIGDLIQKREEEMLQYKNFGKKSLQELKDLLSSMGLSFKKD